MASKSFTLAEAPENGGERSFCAKFCICTCILVFIGMLGVAAVYFYQNSFGTCSYPEVDENGLSNWTNSRQDRIAFACFPGYFLEGESELIVASCENGAWNPAPPACNSLPLRIDCDVNNQSLVGIVTMWQESEASPTFIYGLVNYTAAKKPQGHAMQNVLMSKRTCNVSHTIPQDLSEFEPPEESDEEEPITEEMSTASKTNEHISEDRMLRIEFNSTDIKAYRKTEIFMNIIFVDKKTTATLVSVHQHNVTLVMTNSDGVHSVNSSSWNWEKERRVFQENNLKRVKRMFPE